MSKRLFVGGLPYDTNDEKLQELFSQVGTVVSASVIVDKFSGRSKGFGFVEMETDEEADKAIKELHDKEFGGRKLAVNEARPLEDRPPRRDFNRGGGGYQRGGGNDRRGDRGGSRGGGSRRW